jgi:hypothetical protein
MPQGTHDESWDDVLSKHAGHDGIPDQDDPALTFGEMDGGATMRPANKELARLHVIDAEGNVKTFAYDHFDVRHEFYGARFSVFFAGTKHWRLDVEGTNLWRAYDYITLRRWPYLRAVPGNAAKFAGNGVQAEPVITKVEWHDVTPRPEATV